MKDFHEFGQRLAAACHGVAPQEYSRMTGQTAVLSSDEGGDFQREICKIAAAAFENEQGQQDSQIGIFFEKLASVPEWNTTFNRYTDPVLRALGKVMVDMSVEGHEKVATAAAILPGVIASDKTGIPSVVKMLLGLGAVGGAGAGSLAFLLSRNARQSSAESQELLQKARAYKQLRREVEEDMSLTDAMSDEDSKPARPTRYSL